MNFDELKSPGLQAKLKGAGTPEELLALAREEGFELSDEELDAVSGGKDWWKCEDYSPTTGPY